MDNWEYNHASQIVVGSGNSKVIRHVRTFSMVEKISTDPENDNSTDFVELNKSISIIDGVYFYLESPRFSVAVEEFGRLGHGPTGWIAMIYADLASGEDGEEVVVYSRYISDILMFDRNDDGGADANYVLWRDPNRWNYNPFLNSTRFTATKIRYRLECSGSYPWPSKLTWNGLTDVELSILTSNQLE